jgi:hypothetical protein
MQIVVSLLVVAIIGFNIYATRALIRGEAAQRRRIAQLIIVWLLPVFGAAVVTLVHRGDHPGPEPDLDYQLPIRTSDADTGHHP